MDIYKLLELTPSEAVHCPLLQSVRSEKYGCERSD
ncbi:MAG: hypothetical protein ACLUTU_07555 [Blautia faecis]